MYNIPVILGTVRAERQSIKPAQYIVSRLEGTAQVSTRLIDLAEYEFPFLQKQHRFLEEPPDFMQEFSDSLNRADAVVIVSPEYNNGYPGVLKNAIDHFLPEFKRKPVGIVTVSNGALGGINCMQQLRQVCYGLGAFAVPVGMLVPRVRESFDEAGTPTDPLMVKKADTFLAELLWYTEAITAQRNREQPES